MLRQWATRRIQVSETHKRDMGRGAQAQSKPVRMNENMPGDKPKACLAPLPYTLFKTSHVVFGHVSLRCAWHVLQHRLMVKSMPLRLVAKI